MKKHILILSLILMFFGFVTNAQTTVSIPDTNAAPGEIVIPVNASDSLEIGSMTLNITFDQDVLEFIEFENNPFEGEQNFVVNSQSGKLTIVWYSLTSKEIVNKVFDIKFNYLGGSSAISFEGTNEFSDGSAQDIDVTFDDGSIAPFPTSVTLSDEVALPGDSVSVSITGKNLVGIGSITLDIAFDTSVVEFLGLQNDILGFADPGSGADGSITLAWYNTTPVTYNDDVLAELHFVYSNGNTDVTFGTNSEVTDSVGNTVVTIFNDGSVNAPSASFILPEVETNPFSEVTVPLIGQLLEDIGSFTVSISYDATIASFNRVENLVSGDLVVNETIDNNVATLRMAYANTTGFSIEDGTIVDLLFDVTDVEVGNSTDLSFVGDLEVTDIDENVLTSVMFVDGSIKVVENIAPSFAAVLTDTTLVEGDSLSFQYTAEDPDNLELVYSLVDGPGAIDSLTGEYSWKTEDGDVGEYSVVVSVSDGFLSDTTSANITVLDDNSPPVFTTTIPDGTVFTPELTEAGWVVHTFQYAGSDPDGDEVSFFLVDGPEGSSITEDGLFSWELTDQYAAQSNIPITVAITDGLLNTEHTSLVNTDNIVDVEDNAIPTDFSLDQNYPNPFNPSTTIKFGLPKASDVSIKIYNLLGQEVTTLVNKGMEAGFHTINFDASNLISGLYVYRIKAVGSDGANFVDVKKMMLIK